MRNAKTGGFTLIELLIVIAIIGILAAVLIPNLLSARKRAYDTGAQSCASALAKGAEIYLIDNPDATQYPAAATLTGDSEKYGTNQCVGVATLTATGAAANIADGYEYVVKDTRGTNQYTVTPDGMETAPQN